MITIISEKSDAEAGDFSPEVREPPYLNEVAEFMFLETQVEREEGEWLRLIVNQSKRDDYGRSTARGRRDVK